MTVKRKTGATCIMCGLAAGNSIGIPVHRYPLRRSVYVDGWHVGDPVRHLTVGSVGLCDDCIRRYGSPARRRRHSARNRQEA